MRKSLLGAVVVAMLLAVSCGSSSPTVQPQSPTSIPSAPTVRAETGQLLPPTDIPPTLMGSVEPIPIRKHDLNAIVHPDGSGIIVLNPPPMGDNKYLYGRTVTIDVIPNPGWKVDRWVGPISPIDETQGEVLMSTDQNVVVRLIEENANSGDPLPVSSQGAGTSTPTPMPVPTATPTPEPTWTPVPVPTATPTP